MKVLKARQIVVEIERVRMIRKHAQTQIAVCRTCGGESDFLPFAEASQLFEIESETLLRFVSDNRCHFQTDREGTMFLCLTSLLEKMRLKSGNSEGRRLQN